MPFIEDNMRPQHLANIAPPDEPDLDPSLVETFAAAFRTQNTIGSALAARGMPDPYEIEEGFDSIDYFIEQGMDQYVEEGAGIFNQRAADAKIAQIKREEQDNRTRAASGGVGFIADVAAGVFDLPTLAVPGSVIGVGARATRSLALGVAGGAALDASVSETALQATQATRTAEETAVNIGGSIILGGALGALIGKYLRPADITGLSQKIERQEQEWTQFDDAFSATSAGAAARDKGALTLKDEAVISRLPIINRQDPLIRLQLSPFESGRQTVRGLAETPLEYKENAAGVATEKGGSAETRIKMWNAPTARSFREIDTLYAKYYHSTPEPTAWQRRLSPMLSEFDRVRGGKKLTYKQFKEEAGRAAYMGEVHEIPEISQAAQIYREFDDGLKQAAIEARIPGFTEDMQVAGDISHRFRVYNREKVIARRNEFSERLFDYFRVQRDIAAKVAETVSAEAEEAVKKAAAKSDDFGRMSDEELQSVVDEVIDTILGNAEGRIPYDIVAGPRGPLKERVLKIESAKIHEFLENDIEHIMRMQVRTMAPDIELSKKFGSTDLKEEIRKINDEANAKIAKARTETERKRLENARKESVRDIEAIRDRLRGTYALPSNPASLVVRANRVARNLNYVRLLGGMTISAIPDMAKVVFTHGLTSTFRDGFMPLIRNLKAAKLAAEEVKLAGTALDMILDSRVMAIADITDDFGRHSKFERGLSAMSSRFGVASLMSPWNAAMKQFAGIVTMTNMLRAVEKAAKGTASTKEIRRLAAAGIDNELAERIAKQFAKHGEKRDGLYLAQTEGWADRGAIEAVRAAIVRDVDRIIVTPGQDRPLWMSTELGKTIGQFKSFAVSSMQKTMLAGIQQRDAATLNGTLLMMGLGAMVYALKERNAGRELSDDPRVWAVNAFDRSGLTGWLMEANNISEKFTRGRVGLSAISGEQVSRYASRNVTGAFLGPSADAVADIFQVSGSVFAGDTTRSDLRRARMMVPGQNLFYLRSLFNSVEEATGDTLNLPARAN